MSGQALSREGGAWTPEELEALSPEELFQAYKATSDPELKWPLVMRYVGLVRSIALQVRGVYSSFAQVDDIVNEGLLTLRDLCLQAHPGGGDRPGPAAGLGAPQRAAEGPGHRPGQQ